MNKSNGSKKLKDMKLDASKLSDLRVQSGLTLEALAEEIEVDSSTISLWESGGRQPGPQNLKRLADYFKVPIRSIMAALALLLVSSASSADLAWREVTVHISDSDHMTKAECDSWHRERGWDGCGYNFVVEHDGAIYEARGYGKTGAHVAGRNTGNLGFCFVTKDKATPEQIEAFWGWMGQTRAIYGDLPIHPHREFNAGKTCPAGVWDQLFS